MYTFMCMCTRETVGSSVIILYSAVYCTVRSFSGTFEEERAVPQDASFHSFFIENDYRMSIVSLDALRKSKLYLVACIFSIVSV